MLALTDPWAGHDALRGRTVLLAMSGGVDSSAAAVLLQRRGARVLGLTMKNFCYSDVEDGGNTSCCSLSHLLDARRVCEVLGIEHFLLDATRLFGRLVIDRFVSEYEVGRTPNPCVDCNQLVRFPLLVARARELGASLVATGHYARSGRDAAGRHFVRRGVDASKDQSYFLHGVPHDCLECCVFPLGDLEKSEARRVAREAGLPVAEKPESQEICFLPAGGRGTFLEERGSPRQGELVDVGGTRLGAHRGIGNFTVGQRRGLNVAVGRPLYVQRIEAETDTVVLGDVPSLGSGGIEIDHVWLGGEFPPGKLGVQVRYRSAPAAVREIVRTGGRALVRFASPQRAVAPGQAAVLYGGDAVVGGGRIAAPLE
ncbi:MAG: tRNA 2-thiouridine(34) synthase MnmA [Candidatus Krumholzibacteriia bacterium]